MAEAVDLDYGGVSWRAECICESFPMETTFVAGAPTKIGLVDDDASIRKSVVRLLRSHGYACKAYDSGEMALADPELLGMDCLLIDIQLEGINGIELRDRVLAQGIQMPHFYLSMCGSRLARMPAADGQQSLPREAV